ncbi:MAG: GGDEF domain-containing protein, partial [Clostridia bacterium]|nr:GGDEF domain-containing protein [Clostridia bacterium]
KQNTQLKELVRLDPMTQLLNHEASFAALTDEIKRSRRMNDPLSILIMDLDDFKSINDTYGHLVGDHVIRQTAAIIRQTVRITDQVGRYGGEEFIVIMPDTDLAAASVVAARVRQALEQADFDHSFKVTVSGGISQFQLESIDELIRQTDSKLYLAKKTGKNRIVDSLA